MSHSPRPSFLPPNSLSVTASLILLLLPLATEAGTYSVTYSGGIFSNAGDKDPYTESYSVSSTNSPAGSYGDSGGNTTDYYGDDASADVGGSGEITATFTWQPDYPGEQPPSCAVVQQSSNVFAASDGMGTGSLDDGFGGTASVPEAGGNELSKTQYSVKDNPGSSFTVKCSPSADSGGVFADVEASVGYTAAAHPVTITLSGAVRDNSGNWNILIGQHCSASLSGIPGGCTVSNYNWSVSGSTFQTWSADTPPFPVIVGGIQIGIIPDNPDATYEVDGPGPLTNPTAGWFWNDLAKGTGNSTQETVSCTATVTPPAGQGSAFTESATQPVTVWTGTGNGSAINVDNKYQPPDFWLHAGYAITGLGAFSGMTWKANLSPPPSPVSFGAGSLALVQIITSQDCGFTTNTTPSVPLPYLGNGQTGLDLSWPYPWETSSPTSVGMYYTSGDSPGVPLTLAQSAHDNFSFEDHLMYCPPGSVQYVPVAKYIWSANMSATLPATGNWINFAGSAGTITDSQNAGTFLPNNTFPAWTQIVQ